MNCKLLEDRVVLRLLELKHPYDAIAIATYIRFRRGSMPYADVYELSQVQNRYGDVTSGSLHSVIWSTVPITDGKGRSNRLKSIYQSLKRGETIYLKELEPNEDERAI